MLAAGVLLTVLGGVALIIPGAVVLSSDCADFGCGIKQGIGGILVGVGAAMVVAGIPLWAVGQTRLARARRLSIAPSVQPAQRSVAATLTVRF
jgi:hypothetical protein